MQDEIWKDVVGYEQFYQVSNKGRVRRKKDFYELSQQIGSGGYKQVALSKCGKAKMIPVHRIVAKAFIKNELNFPCVNHKDEDKQNNNADNLEWCSYSYNINYGTRTLRANETKRKSREKALSLYKPNGDTTEVPTKAIFDRNLSLGAKGVYCSLCHMPTIFDENMAVAYIAEHSTNSAYGIKSALQELVANGYVEVL